MNKKWAYSTTEELKLLTSQRFTDRKIANLLNAKFSTKFTPMSIKRKRHRLNLIKKESKVISEREFKISLKKRNGMNKYNQIIFPREIAEKLKLRNGDNLLLKCLDKKFISKIGVRRRKDRKNNSFVFTIPFKLADNFNLIKDPNIQVLSKINKLELDPNKIFFKNTLDLKYLFPQINRKYFRFTLDLGDKNKLIISLRGSNPLNLSRYIKLNENLFQVLGLFQGEGTKTHDRRVEFVNSNSSIINLFLKYFDEVFGVLREKWRARVIYTSASRFNKTKESELQIYWNSKTQIPLENFVKSKWVKGNQGVKNGSLVVYLPSSAMREIWFSIRDYCYQKLNDKPTFSSGFMQGVLAADGCPILRKDGVLDSITIRIENKEEADLYITALMNLGIKPHVKIKYRSIRIHGKLNFMKVATYDLFKLHNERKMKFLTGLKKYKWI